MKPETVHALQHVLWLLHHGYAHRAKLELREIVWAIRRGFAA